MKTKCVFTQLIVVFAVLFVHTCFAQLSAYHGIVFPYEGQALAGKALGGVTVAAPDYVPDARGNPAGLAFTENIQFFAGVNSYWDSYKLDYELLYMDKEKSKISYTRYHFLPSQFSVAVPFRLYNKKTTVAVSVNKINSPEIETMNIPEIKKDLNYRYNSNGTVWNSSLAAAIRLNENLSIGFSWTQWYGKWDWRTEHYIDQFSKKNVNIGRGTFKYKGSSFSLGVLQQFRKLSVGLVLHSPFTLMKADKIKPESWIPSESIDLEQRFNGAVYAGLVYQVSPRSRIGFGYRHQDTFTTKETFEFGFTVPIDNYYSNSHKVSIAGEYALNIFSLRVPVFLAYYGQWLPLTEQTYWRHQSLFITEKNRYQNGAALGLKLDFNNMEFFFVTSWNRYSFKAEQSMDPPFS